MNNFVSSSKNFAFKNNLDKNITFVNLDICKEII